MEAAPPPRLLIRRHSLQNLKQAQPVRQSVTALGSAKAAFGEGPLSYWPDFFVA